MHKYFLSIAFILLITVSVVLADDVEVEVDFESINKEDRILILAPHPDDEDLGCGGLIQRALKIGVEVKIAYLSNGDHNEFRKDYSYSCIIFYRFRPNS